MKSDIETGATVVFDAGGTPIEGDLLFPEDRPAIGVVSFAHGSGSSRFSSRNRFVARRLREAGLATLLIDLLTPEEEQLDLRTRHLRFDIPLLSRRVVAGCDWLRTDRSTARLPVALFGGSTGAAAAIIAAAERPDIVGAVVSRGGRPDLANSHLPDVRTPVLLIVGGQDQPVIEINRQAMEQMAGTTPELQIIPGASHLFEEPGALESVADLATDWLVRQLRAAPDR